MIAKLVAEKGNKEGLVFALDNKTTNRWLVGSDPENCDFILEDPNVSLLQFVLTKTADGFSIENLSDDNPTLLNEKIITGTDLLQNEDIVKIGDNFFKFYENDSSNLDYSSINQENDEDNNKTKDQQNNNNQHDDNHNNDQHVEDNENEIRDKVLENEELLTKSTDKEELSKEDTDTTTIQNEDTELLDSMLIQEKNSDLENTHHEEDHISIFEDLFGEEKNDYPQVNFDLTETERWLLKVVGGPNHGAEFSMQPNTNYIIGTDPNSCDIVFHDTSVSRQHAKIIINEDETITLEDLKSRNGTFIEGKQLTGKESIPTNTLIMMGTSSFVVYDREGEMQTIISPLLPSIVKVLQGNKEVSDSIKTDEDIENQTPQTESSNLSEPIPIAADVIKEKTHTHDALGAFILIAIITGLFVVIGIGTTTLFKSQPIVNTEVIHPDKDFGSALANFPSIKYSFNKNTGRLLLVGHVLTASDKNQLLYNLQGIKYIKNIDDSGVIIDEGVWREINMILSQNQNWKGISIQSPTPGHFVISGFLKTRKQAEQLWEYISSNFPYLDLLEKRVIVEEDVAAAVGLKLQTSGFKNVTVQINEGEVILTGHVTSGKIADYNKILSEIKEIPGVRNIKNYVSELAPEQSMVNISDKYDISGVSQQGSVSTSVVINGRILTRGDTLDGMTITSIKPNAVFLEKDGIKYRIDYNR